MKNVVEIDSLSENLEKISIKDSLAQKEKDKKRDDSNGEDHDIEVELFTFKGLEICYKPSQGPHQR